MAKMERLFKCLKKGRIGQFSGFIWPVRKWVRAEGELVVCKNGIHLCRERDLVYWLNTEIWEAEYRGEERISSNDKIVVREAKLTRKLKTWDGKTARLLAADCAEHVLYIFAQRYPDDKGPRQAIEATRKYAYGKISKDKLKAAARAARAAAWAAGEAAGATEAAWAAGEAAGATEAAWATWAAAGTAEAAARAARAAAWAAEREWQTKRLLLILDGKLYVNKKMSSKL